MLDGSRSIIGNTVWTIDAAEDSCDGGRHGWMVASDVGEGFSQGEDGTVAIARRELGDFHLKIVDDRIHAVPAGWIRGDREDREGDADADDAADGDDEQTGGAHNTDINEKRRKRGT